MRGDPGSLACPLLPCSEASDDRTFPLLIATLWSEPRCAGSGLPSEACA